MAQAAEELLGRRGVQHQLVGACVYRATCLATTLGARAAHSAACALIDLGLMAAFAAVGLFVLGVNFVFQAGAYVVVAPWLALLHVLSTIQDGCVVAGQIMLICGRIAIIALRWATTYQGHRLFFLDPLTLEAMMPSAPAPVWEDETGMESEMDEDWDQFVYEDDVVVLPGFY